MTQDELQAASIATVAATPGALAAICAPVRDLPFPAPADEWNERDVVAHLIVTGRGGALARIERIVAEDNPALQNMDEEETLRASGLREQPLRELLQTFTTERNAHVDLLRTLGAGDLARTGTHSVAGVVSAREFLHHAAYHDCLHLAQLSAMLGQRFEPHRGAMRMF